MRPDPIKVMEEFRKVHAEWDSCRIICRNIVAEHGEIKKEYEALAAKYKGEWDVVSKPYLDRLAKLEADLRESNERLGLTAERLIIEQGKILEMMINEFKG